VTRVEDRLRVRRSSSFGLLLCRFARLRRAVLEPEAVVSGFEDVAAVSEAIEQSRRHLGVPEDGGPFAETEVRRDDDAGPLVELAQQIVALPLIRLCFTLGANRPIVAVWLEMAHLSE
jgi:hypothetical protein